MVQPQPHTGSSQWEMSGEEAVGTGSNGSLGPSSQGSLRVPPELAGNEVVLRLVGDNCQLKEALKRSNDSLRERCGEMEGWQKKAREEREFLSCRFREAKALVERLQGENQVLLGKFNHNAGRSKTSLTETGSQAPDSEERSNGLQDSLESAEGHLNPEKCDLEKHRSLSCGSDSSFLSSLIISMEDLTSFQEGCGDEEPSEGTNEFLQLLKSHKDKLERNMKDMRRKNEELEKEKAEGEKERDGLLATVDQLHTRLSQLTLQGGAVMTEAVQRSDAPHMASDSGSQLSKMKDQLQATQERYKELEEKLDCLQKSSVHRDRAEVQLKQKEKDCAQLAKDSEALKAQVTSLLGELHEKQSCLEKSDEKRRELEEKLSSKTESLQTLERDMEQQRRQNSVTVDKLLMQVQNLEAALKKDRLVITEERRKLAQLQHAYTCLFQDYDAKLKAENQAKGGEVGDLANRLVEAEKALALKQDLIDKLKEEAEQQRSVLETVPVLTAQAEIYKSDFLAERAAREKLHQTKEELLEQLNQANADIERLKQEGTSRARLEAMQNRHIPAPPQFNQAQPPQSFRSAEEQPDFRCPKCRYQAPDMDTLQIHVMDCIQ
ncbi:NF-kappa-B essential modulator isoform X2 [Clupea harengus]|uniref:NF-kappa-B essential modulator n=1 Tax=Clupea harengus TaxID=7950 RepID=A0A6P8EZ45_CLUHA|nr:NF-kappa-B essential modulator isoform X2 [Clupea harengus]